MAVNGFGFITVCVDLHACFTTGAVVVDPNVVYLASDKSILDLGLPIGVRSVCGRAFIFQHAGTVKRTPLVPAKIGWFPLGRNRLL